MPQYNKDIVLAADIFHLYTAYYFQHESFNGPCDNNIEEVREYSIIFFCSIVWIEQTRERDTSYIDLLYPNSK